MTTKEIFDFGVMLGRAAQMQSPMPSRHCDVPGDYHEREFVKAMLEDGLLQQAEDDLLRQVEDELDRQENIVGRG